MRHTPSPRSVFFTVAALVSVLLVWATAANAQLGGLPYVDPRVLALEIKCNKLQDTINKLEGAVRELGVGATFKDNAAMPGAWTVGATAFGEMLPNHDNMISLDSTKKDKWGLPVLKIDCATGENERRWMGQGPKRVRASAWAGVL